MPLYYIYMHLNIIISFLSALWIFFFLPYLICQASIFLMCTPTLSLPAHFLAICWRIYLTFLFFDLWRCPRCGICSMMFFLSLQLQDSWSPCMQNVFACYGKRRLWRDQVSSRVCVCVCVCVCREGVIQYDLRVEQGEEGVNRRRVGKRGEKERGKRKREKGREERFKESVQHTASITTGFVVAFAQRQMRLLSFTDPRFHALDDSSSHSRYDA